MTHYSLFWEPFLITELKKLSGHQATGAAGTIGSKLVSGSLSISPASRSNVQYNPAGDIKSKIKTSSLEIGFLGKKFHNVYNVKKLSCIKMYQKSLGFWIDIVY